MNSRSERFVLDFLWLKQQQTRKHRQQWDRQHKRQNIHFHLLKPKNQISVICCSFALKNCRFIQKLSIAMRRYHFAAGTHTLTYIQIPDNTVHQKCDSPKIHFLPSAVELFRVGRLVWVELKLLPWLVVYLSFKVKVCKLCRKRIYYETNMRSLVQITEKHIKMHFGALNAFELKCL